MRVMSINKRSQVEKCYLKSVSWGITTSYSEARKSKLSVVERIRRQFVLSEEFQTIINDKISTSSLSVRLVSHSNAQNPNERRDEINGALRLSVDTTQKSSQCAIPSMSVVLSVSPDITLTEVPNSLIRQLTNSLRGDLQYRQMKQYKTIENGATIYNKHQLSPLIMSIDSRKPGIREATQHPH